jgi:2-hydroxy-6-oxonona-2,4-dienedioate hydrolase
MSRFFRRQFMGLMGASSSVVAELTAEQRDIIIRIIDYMNPAAPRSAGAAFDNEAALPGERIAGVRAPALIVHAEDDLLQLFHNAEFAVGTIPGARLMRFEAGGHVVVVVQREAIGAAVRSHILSHAGVPSREGEPSRADVPRPDAP